MVSDSMGASALQQAAASATFGRSKLTATRPLDQSQVLDPRVQDMAALSGTRVRLRTNIPDDHGTAVQHNVNSLTFKRKQSFSAVMSHRDGGLDYDAQTVVGNWVEDRRDPNYRSGTHPKELMRGRLYQTEHTANFRPHSASYMDTIKSQYGTAKFPEKDTPRRVQSAVQHTRLGTYRGAHVHYARDGFGPAATQDHTTEPRRGAFWVGTAPHKQYESVARSSGQQQPLEFQNRCSTQDGTSMLLLKTKPLTHTDASTMRTTDKLVQSQRWTKTWETSNKIDFVRHSLR